MDQWFIIQPGSRLQTSEEFVRPQKKLMMIQAPAVNHSAGHWSFVVTRFVESNSETSHAGPSLLGQRSRHTARVKTTAEQDADGDITNAALVNRIVKGLAKPADGIVWHLTANGSCALT